MLQEVKGKERSIMPFYERKGSELVPLKEDVPDEMIAAIERADNEAIVESMTTGFAEENYLYSFPVSGKEVVGISWSGAKRMAQNLGNIEVLPDIKVEERDGAFYGMVRARDLLRNVTLLGVARQPMEKVLRTGEIKPDEHAFTVAINKGQRNAILNLVPEDAKVRILQHFLEQKRPKNLQGGQPKAMVKASSTERPPAKEEDKKGEPPAQPEWENLGFLSEQDRSQKRTELFNQLKAKGLVTQEQIVGWLKEHGEKDTKSLHRDTLNTLIAQAKIPPKESPEEPPF